MIIGYTRSIVGDTDVLSVQKNLIESYCKRNGIECDAILSDEGYRYRLTTELPDLSDFGYTKARKDEKVFGNLDRIVELILQDKVEILITDFEFRLFANKAHFEFLKRIVIEHNVKLCFCNGEIYTNTENEKRAGVIYHFTNDSSVRPIVVEKEIDELYAFACAENISIVGIYLDYSLKIQEQLQYKFLTEQQNIFHVLIVKDLYHIHRKTTQMVEAIQFWYKHGVAVKTKGEISPKIIPDELLLSLKMHVAMYDSWSDDDESKILQRRIFRLFIAKKTKWYHDENDYFVEPNRVVIDGERHSMKQLMKSISGYDIVLVSSFSRVNVRTSKFEKIMKAMKNVIIYSLEEGGMMLD